MSAEDKDTIVVISTLTAAGSIRITFRRELCRWRGLLAELYLDPGNTDRHEDALAVLLLFSPAAAAQRRFLLPHR